MIIFLFDFKTMSNKGKKLLSLEAIFIISEFFIKNFALNRSNGVDINFKFFFMC